MLTQMQNTRTSAIFDQLDPIFHPDSIALVGITISNPVHWTRTFWNALIDFPYSGALYPVNPRGGELNGHKVYGSLEEIPGNIDYVISTVSAKSAAEVIVKSAQKGARAIQLCTAGFSELGDDSGAALEKELSRLARLHNIRIIGPNCLGIYCPDSKLAFAPGFARESGPVGFISQSGSNAICVTKEAQYRGVLFSKVVSYGNACDLDESELLEYMIDDPETKIIALYLEGVKDGRRFASALQKAMHLKPVVLLKSGRGEAGSRATASHTGSLAGNNTTWDALCRQYNVIRAKNVESMVDILVTLAYMGDPGGNNVIIMGPGGGPSVLLTDEFEDQGFNLPRIPEPLIKQLLEFSSLEGNILHNPIDYSQNFWDAGLMSRAIGIISSWDGADFMVGYYRTIMAPTSDFFVTFQSGIDGIHYPYTFSHKPTAMIFEPSLLPDCQSTIYPLMQKSIKAGIPIYCTFSGAASALRTVVDYYQRKNSPSL